MLPSPTAASILVSFRFPINKKLICSAKIYKKLVIIRGIPSLHILIYISN
jgi:hypothetical protein